jgi:hypothetical protein
MSIVPHRETEASSAIAIAVVEHVVLALVLEHKGIFDHLGIPTIARNVDTTSDEV